MGPLARFLRGFGRFWYDFIVGDDPKIAVAVAAVLVLGAAVVGPGGQHGPALVLALALLLMLGFAVALLVDVARSRSGRG